MTDQPTLTTLGSNNFGGSKSVKEETLREPKLFWRLKTFGANLFVLGASIFWGLEYFG